MLNNVCFVMCGTISQSRQSLSFTVGRMKKIKEKNLSVQFPPPWHLY